MAKCLHKTIAMLTASFILAAYGVHAAAETEPALQGCWQTEQVLTYLTDGSNSRDRLACVFDINDSKMITQCDDGDNTASVIYDYKLTGHGEYIDAKIDDPINKHHHRYSLEGDVLTITSNPASPPPHTDVSIDRVISTSQRVSAGSQNAVVCQTLAEKLSSPIASSSPLVGIWRNVPAKRLGADIHSGTNTEVVLRINVDHSIQLFYPCASIAPGGNYSAETGLEGQWFFYGDELSLLLPLPQGGRAQYQEKLRVQRIGDELHTIDQHGRQDTYISDTRDFPPHCDITNTPLIKPANSIGQSGVFECETRGEHTIDDLYAHLEGRYHVIAGNASVAATVRPDGTIGAVKIKAFNGFEVIEQGENSTSQRVNMDKSSAHALQNELRDLIRDQLRCTNHSKHTQIFQLNFLLD